MTMMLRTGFLLLTLIASPVLAQDISQSSPSPSRPGIGVDARGGQVIDPTENVKALSEAANKRQDDLRAAADKLFESKLQDAEKVSELRYAHTQELALLQARKIEEEAKLRAEYSDRLQAAEAKRIDAIRAVDVGAAANLAQRTTEQATALATVVTQSAEVLRNQVSRAAEDTRALVATTAATALQNQQQQFSALSTRIAALEQSQSEGKGKQTIQDPGYLALQAQVQALLLSKTAVTATDAGRSDVVGWAVGGIMLLLSMAGFVFVAFRQQKSRR